MNLRALLKGAPRLSTDLPRRKVLCLLAYGIGDDHWENLGPFEDPVLAAEDAVNRGAEWIKVTDMGGRILFLH